ncbi:WXG100 family type VII secretion target [Lysinibacter cavernae]|uniref:WXG100 family type VII secretion target n=1 Tax=Lysinibacter cavernae TaxID=1640652 RepID=A0A7X5R1L9_9MICO|nr:WXG100 family type VII secretion target [Lysinibacter cavernae]
MNDHIGVDRKSIESMQHALGESTNYIGQILQDMDEQVRLLRSQWSGDAADAYELSKREFLFNLDGMHLSLGRFSDAVGESNRLYSDVEKTNANLWAR